MPPHRRLEATEAEVGTPFQHLLEALGEVGLRPFRPIVVSELGHREGNRLRIAETRAPVDERPTRIPESHQLGYLVVRLPRRIVARPPDESIHARSGQVIQARVPARDHEDDGWVWEVAVVQRQRLDVPRKVMDREHRNTARGANGLGEADADEQRAHQARPLRDGDGIDVVPGRAGLLERSLDDAADVAQVLAGREFGDDTTPTAPRSGSPRRRATPGRRSIAAPRRRTAPRGAAPDRHAVGADLVGRVAVGRDAVGADDHAVDRASRITARPCCR